MDGPGAGCDGKIMLSTILHQLKKKKLAALAPPAAAKANSKKVRQQGSLHLRLSRLDVRLTDADRLFSSPKPPAVCLTAPRKVYRPPVFEPAAAPDKDKVGSPKMHHPPGWEPVEQDSRSTAPMSIPTHVGSATPWWEAPVAQAAPAREWAVTGAPSEDGTASASRPGSESPRSCGGEYVTLLPPPLPPVPHYQQQMQQQLEGLLSTAAPPNSAEAWAAQAYEARLVKHLSHGQWVLLSLLGDRVKGCPMPPSVGMQLKAFIMARPHLFHLLWDVNQGTWRAKLRAKPLQAGGGNMSSPTVAVALPAVPSKPPADLDCMLAEQLELVHASVSANPWRMAHLLPDCSSVCTEEVAAVEPISSACGLAPPLPPPASDYGLFSNHPLAALHSVFNGNGGSAQPLAHMQHPTSGPSAYDVLCGPQRNSTASLGGFSQAIAAASSTRETAGLFGSMGSEPCAPPRGPSVCFGDAAIRALASSAPPSPHNGHARFAPTAGSASLPGRELFIATSAPATAAPGRGYQPYFASSDMGAAVAGYMHLDASGGSAMCGTQPVMRSQAGPRALPPPRMPEAGMYCDRAAGSSPAVGLWQRQKDGDDDADALLLECLSMGATLR